MPFLRDTTLSLAHENVVLLPQGKYKNNKL